MSAQSLKLSICIPTFERAIFLDYLLKNIDEESYKLEFPFEIIISDNASNDDTSKIVEKWKSKLKLKYFRQKTNIGAVQNYNFVINQASGEFSLYLADDDILDFSSLNSCIFEFSEMPNVGAYYAPWKIGDPEGNTFTQFFSIQTGMYFQKGDYPKFLELVLKNHIFPEIGIFRTQILKSLSPIIRLDIAFNFFTIAAEWLSHSDVYMSNQCFYLSISKHPAGERTQAGFEQVEFMWDSYRGGLELFLGHFVKNISADVAARYREGINQFIAIRMSVAIRVRLINKRDRIEIWKYKIRYNKRDSSNILSIK